MWNKEKEHSKVYTQSRLGSVIKLVSHLELCKRNACHLKWMCFSVPCTCTWGHPTSWQNSHLHFTGVLFGLQTIIYYLLLDFGDTARTPWAYLDIVIAIEGQRRHLKCTFKILHCVQVGWKDFQISILFWIFYTIIFKRFNVTFNCFSSYETTCTVRFDRLLFELCLCWGMWFCLENGKQVQQFIETWANIYAVYKARKSMTANIWYERLYSST